VESEAENVILEFLHNMDDGDVTKAKGLVTSMCPGAEQAIDETAKERSFAGVQIGESIPVSTINADVVVFRMGNFYPTALVAVRRFDEGNVWRIHGMSWGCAFLQ
jgi:hypothetical protein